MAASPTSPVPQSWIATLGSYFAAAAKKLANIVLHPTGSSAYNAAAAGNQYRQIEAIANNLKVQAADWIGKAMPTAIVNGIKTAESQAKVLQVTVPGLPLTGSFNLIDPNLGKVLAKDAYNDLLKATNSLEAQAEDALRKTRQAKLSEQDINQILATGTMNGDTPAATIKALSEALEKVHGNTVTIIDKNGKPINFDVDYYAKMVVATKTREASEKASMQRLASMGIDLVTIQGRVSKNFCTAYLGMVFSISGKSDQYPALAELPSHGPPFHPHCSKSTSAFVEDLATEKQLSLADGVADAEKLLNVDASTAQKRYKDLQIHQQVKDRYLKKPA